jgi:hypothetical protein
MGGCPATPDSARESAIKNQHLVGGACLGRELVHGASLRSLHKLALIDATRIHAGAAEKHAAFARQDALEHALDIVETVGRLLCCFGGEHGIGHQEDCHLMGGVLLGERVREAQGVVDPLTAIGRVVDDE